MRIGFIGLGRMGFSLARSLVRNQQNVTALDIDPAVVEKLTEEGAHAAASVAALCQQSNIVFKHRARRSCRFAGRFLAST